MTPAEARRALTQPEADNYQPEGLSSRTRDDRGAGQGRWRAASQLAIITSADADPAITVNPGPE